LQNGSPSTWYVRKLFIFIIVIVCSKFDVKWIAESSTSSTSSQVFQVPLPVFFTYKWLLKKKIFSDSSKLPAYLHRDAMLSVYSWRDYIEEWDLRTSFHNTCKQILRHTRKIRPFDHSAWKRYLRRGRVHITSDWNDSDIELQAHLWNIQNCQVKILRPQYSGKSIVQF